MYAPQKEGSTEFERPPEGGSCLVCTRIIDKGTVYNEKKDADVRSISLVFEHPELMKEGDFKDEPYLIFQSFGNYSMYQNSHLCKFIEAWRGQPFSDQKEADSFDIETLLKQPCFANIQYNGQYVNVVSPMPVPNGMEPPLPKGKVYCLDMSNIDMQVFEQLSDNMKAHIQKSKEWQAKDTAYAKSSSDDAAPMCDGAAPTQPAADVDVGDGYNF